MLFILLLISLSSSAQDYKKNIRERFADFAKLMVDGEFDKSMDYIPEAMFRIVPKAQMVAALKQVMKGKFQIKMLGFDIKDISDSRKIDTFYYAKIKYVSAMTMKITADRVETAEAKKNRLASTTVAFANTFGSDNVKLDEATETYTLTPTKSSWAISKNGQTGWKFLNVEPKQRILLEKILPKVLIEESLN
ncbi:MAG TPA: hypothetical protein VKB19_04075 [Pedobacter sp.]|nr:hypothetical protein [Pedobacter sp.]